MIILWNSERKHGFNKHSVTNAWKLETLRGLITIVVLGFEFFYNSENFKIWTIIDTYANLCAPAHLTTPCTQSVTSDRIRCSIFKRLHQSRNKICWLILNDWIFKIIRLNFAILKDFFLRISEVNVYFSFGFILRKLSFIKSINQPFYPKLKMSPD